MFMSEPPSADRDKDSAPEPPPSPVELNPHFTALLLDAVGQSVMATDPDGKIIFWNRAAEELFGWSRDEVLERPVVEVTPAPELEARAEELMEALRAGESWSGEFTVRRKDGSRFPVLVTDSPVFDGEGRLVAIVGVAVDLTEQRRMERRLQQAQRLEAISALAGGVAHDFNNALTAIRCHADFLMETLENDPRTQEDLQGIRSAVSRAGRLTQHLLAFSRQQVLQPRTVNLSQVLQDWESLIRTVVDSRIQVEIGPPASAVHVRMDPEQMEQVLVELLTNAQDAIPKKGRIRVGVETKSVEREAPDRPPEMPPGEYAVLTVQDDGRGMDGETLERIFEPFFSSKPAWKAAGVGLSTAYGVVKQSGGFIYAESDPGEGTTFRVYLPLEAPTEEVESAGEGGGEPG